MLSPPPSKPAILLVEMDDDARPLFRHNLSNHDYTVIVAISEEDAFERVKDNRAHVDLILLNQVGQSIEAFLEMGRRIRDDAKLPAHLPIVVIADQYEIAQEGQDVEVSDGKFVTYLEDAQQLFNLLARLCPRD